MLSTLQSYLRRHHIGLLALFVALGGVAYAAEGPGRESSGPSARAAGGVPDLVVRKKTVTLSQTCQSNGFGGFNCNGPLRTVTARCRRGERAVSGGYAGTDVTTMQVGGTARQGTPQNVDRPQPARGAPRGWTVTARPFTTYSGPVGPPPPRFTVYAVCAK